MNFRRKFSYDDPTTIDPKNPRHLNRHELAKRAYDRLSRIETVRIIDWCDQSGTGMAVALQDFRRTGQVESLEEARTGAIALLVAFELLQDRVTP